VSALCVSSSQNADGVSQNHHAGINRLVKLSLVIEGWDSEKAENLHLKNYIYFGMAFSFIVEVLNMSMRRRNARRKVVRLNEPRLREEIEEEGKYSDSAH